MGKYLLLSFLIFTTLPALACPNKINPKKVMLFIDANSGDLEIEAAQKSACKRGERLEVVPKAWKQYSTLQKSVETAVKVLQACAEKYPNSSTTMTSECSTQYQAYQDAGKKLHAFTRTQKGVSDQVKERIEELSKEKVKITNVSLSGHDGGGHFGGEKGSISRGEVAAIMAQYPGMNDVQSLLLLGCYTGVQNEVSAWKSIFPKVKLIGGYDGSAPASSRVQGHNYITNILNKEKALLSLKNKTNVDQDVKRMIGNLGELNSAVYIDLACKEEESSEYYYASMLGRKFKKLNLNDCQKALAELEKLKPYYNQLYSGEIEPPTVTSSGPARDLYNKLRTNEHCANPEVGMGFGEMDANGAFNLLFWHGVKKNFAEYYDTDMKEVESILKDVTAEEMTNELLKQIENLENRKKEIANQIAEFEKSPETYEKKLQASIKAAQEEADKATKDPAYIAAMGRMNSGINITTDDVILINKVGQLSSSVFSLRSESASLFDGSGEFMRNKKFAIKNLDVSIDIQNKQLARVPANLENLKKIWIPTKENMENKTRKQIMENLHAINGLMSSGSLPQKKYAALSFVNSVSASHLTYLQNPFSWHEYTGKPEKPPYAQSLSQFTSQNSAMMSPYGYGGGMGMGMGTGMGGGGYIGGSQSGSNGGGQLTEQDGRPVH